jgi:hypothetical protein
MKLATMHVRVKWTRGTPAGHGEMLVVRGNNPFTLPDQCTSGCNHFNDAFSSENISPASLSAKDFNLALRPESWFSESKAFIVFRAPCTQKECCDATTWCEACRGFRSRDKRAHPKKRARRRVLSVVERCLLATAPQRFTTVPRTTQ